ncbi:hypothetical protein DFH09DRAFT_1406544 [Mycena vulgaris]|nr:hypothetical protein DFH09DRAFT_1406544 [Mycena vulgaris]
MNSEPALPVELEREIFETTALMHPRTIFVLLRVARRTHVWIEPLLYRVVLMRGEPPYSGMVHAILVRLNSESESKPASIFRDTVRHLLIQRGDWGRAEAIQILDACPGLVDLAIDGSIPSPAMLSPLAKLRLRRLSVSLEMLFNGLDAIDPTHAMFASLTHLRMLPLRLASRRMQQVCAHFPRLPALTHLCLHFSDDVQWDVLQMLLADCPRLEILAAVWSLAPGDDARAQIQNPPIRDVRLVMGEHNGRWADWEAGARGFPDSWSRAEDFVSRKRSGAIEGTTPYNFTCWNELKRRNPSELLLAGELDDSVRTTLLQLHLQVWKESCPGYSGLGELSVFVTVNAMTCAVPEEEIDSAESIVSKKQATYAFTNTIVTSRPLAAFDPALRSFESFGSTTTPVPAEVWFTQ